MLFSFKYLSFPISNKKNEIIGEICRPQIPIRISYKHKLLGYLISALIDSGADNNLFPSYFGQKIGLNIKKGEEFNIGGIGNIGIKAYRHKIKIFVDSYSFETYVDFSDDQQTPLLGREFFFKFFKNISFDENKKIVSLKTL